MQIKLSKDEVLELEARHNITVSHFPSIVYAKINNTEVGMKYREFGGDKVKARIAAVQAVLEATAVSIYAPTMSEIKELRELTGRGWISCQQALKKCVGDQQAALDYLRRV